MFAVAAASFVALATLPVDPAGASAATSPKAVHWTLVELPFVPLGSKVTVTDGGTVAGSEWLALDTMRAFTWRQGDLEPLAPPPPPSSVVLDFSDLGYGAGYAYDGTHYRAARFAGGTATAIGHLPADSDSVAAAVNRRGVIVGAAGPDVIHFRPVQFTESGTTDLAPGHLGVARDVNDHGDAVGTVIDVVGSEPDRVTSVAALFRHGGVVRLDAGHPEITYSNATAVNGRGVVVGDAFLGSGRVHAVAFVHGDVRDLDPDSGLESHAYAVNDGGDAVGVEDTSAVLFTHGRVVHLDDLLPIGSDLHLTRATSINSTGQIAGFAERCTSYPGGGSSCTELSFLLTPSRG